MSRALRFPLCVAFVAAGIGQLSAQESWRVEAGIRAGAVIPARVLGSSATAEAKMQTDAVLGGSMEVKPPHGPFGIRASGAVGLTKGARISPTAGCTIACVPYIDSEPRFMAAALDLIVRLGTARRFVGLAAGPALRGFQTPSHVFFEVDRLPGEFTGFLVEERVHLAGHGGLELQQAFGRRRLGIHLEDYIGTYHLTGRLQHDVVLSVSLTWL